MQRMNGLLSGLARTFSSDLRAERQNALRSVPSFNEFESHSSTDLAEEQQQAGQPPRSQSLPLNAQLYGAASVTDSETSFSVGSPAAGSVDSPTAAAAAAGAAGPAKQAKKPYKIHGMDAYDYWSLIKSL